MSSIEQLQAKFNLERRLNAINRGTNKADLVQAYAQEMVRRDEAIRQGFKGIFGIIGDDLISYGYEVVTPPITLARSEDNTGAISLAMSTPVRYPAGTAVKTFDPVSMTIYDGRSILQNDVYRTNSIVSKTAAGEDYYLWSQDYRVIAGSHYDGYEAEFRELDAAMQLAELRQSQIWQALGDVTLNPDYAKILTRQT